MLVVGKVVEVVEATVSLLEVVMMDWERQNGRI